MQELFKMQPGDTEALACRLRGLELFRHLRRYVSSLPYSRKSSGSAVVNAVDIHEITRQLLSRRV